MRIFKVMDWTSEFFLGLQQTAWICFFWFCLQQDEKSGKEVILDDSECPLQIFRDWPADRGETHSLSGFLLYFQCLLHTVIFF